MKIIELLLKRLQGKLEGCKIALLSAKSELNTATKNPKKYDVKGAEVEVRQRNERLKRIQLKLEQAKRKLAEAKKQTNTPPGLYEPMLRF